MSPLFYLVSWLVSAEFSKFIGPFSTELRLGFISCLPRPLMMKSNLWIRSASDLLLLLPLLPPSLTRLLFWPIWPSSSWEERKGHGECQARKMRRQLCSSFPESQDKLLVCSTPAPTVCAHPLSIDPQDALVELMVISGDWQQSSAFFFILEKPQFMSLKIRYDSPWMVYHNQIICAGKKQVRGRSHLVKVIKKKMIIIRNSLINLLFSLITVKLHQLVN